YMLAMVSLLGGLLAAILALEPLRQFFELELLSAGQWFICMLSVAAGLVVASLLWRLPYIQRLEMPADETVGTTPAGDALPEATHGPPFSRRRRGSRGNGD